MIIDFKSYKAFPEHPEVCKDKCYQVDNYKRSKVIRSEIKQLKFSKENPKMHYKFISTKKNREVIYFVQNYQRQEALFLNQTKELSKFCDKAPGDLPVKNVKCSDKHQVSLSPP